MRLKKSCSNNIKKNSVMLCIRDFKVKSSLKPLMNFRRNSCVILSKKESEKKSNTLKKKDVNAKFNKPVEEMPNKSSEPDNNVYMKKSSA